LLFLIYINDIYESSKLVDFHLFADDTSLFYKNKDLHTLEKELNLSLIEICNWLKANKLTLNVKKSNLLLFNLSNKNISTTINIAIDNQILEEKNSTKYLGVIFDKKLSWEPHISMVNKKIYRGTGIICKLRHYLSENLIKNIYNAFIQPHIDYGLLAWGSATTTQLKKVAVATNKTIRLLNFKERDESAWPLYQKFKILPLNKNIQLLNATFMWKFCNNILPQPIIEIFETNSSSQAALNANSSKRLFIPHYRTSIAQRTIVYNGPYIWNTVVPKKHREAISACSFRSKLKSYLLL
jgi:hypothetical protein